MYVKSNFWDSGLNFSYLNLIEDNIECPYLHCICGCDEKYCDDKYERNVQQQFVFERLISWFLCEILHHRHPVRKPLPRFQRTFEQLPSSNVHNFNVLYWVMSPRVCLRPSPSLNVNPPCPRRCICL